VAFLRSPGKSRDSRFASASTRVDVESATSIRSDSASIFRTRAAAPSRIHQAWHMTLLDTLIHYRRNPYSRAYRGIKHASQRAVERGLLTSDGAVSWARLYALTGLGERVLNDFERELEDISRNAPQCEHAVRGAFPHTCPQWAGSCNEYVNLCRCCDSCEKQCYLEATADLGKDEAPLRRNP
jgi:hypothetical protein